MQPAFILRYNAAVAQSCKSVNAETCRYAALGKIDVVHCLNACFHENAGIVARFGFGGIIAFYAASSNIFAIVEVQVAVSQLYVKERQLYVGKVNLLQCVEV